MELWQKDLLEVLRDIAQRIPGSYIDDIDRNKVIKQIDVWLKQVGNVAQPDACPQLCDVTALKKYIRSCIDNFARHNKDHPEDTTNSAFQFAFEGIMRKIDELCKD